MVDLFWIVGALVLLVGLAFLGEALFGLFALALASLGDLLRACYRSVAYGLRRRG